MNYMTKLINKYKKDIIIFIISFIILSIFSIFQKITTDVIWSYGFSYNILKENIPYKDFNMIIGPLYSLFNSIPLLIFGNNMIIFKLTHTLIYSLILTIAYKKINKKIIWIILILMIQTTLCWYNTLIGMLIILILILKDTNIKKKDLYIGLIIGFIMMTKHNVGIMLFITYFITSKDKVRNTIYFLIPISIGLIYLIINNTFINYIEFCFLGLGNFIENIRIVPSSLIITILIIIYLTIKYIKTKDTKILYVYASLIILFPLVEINHLLTVILILSYYILLKEKNILILSIGKIIVTIYLISIIINQLNNIEIITSGNHIKYNTEKKDINKNLKSYSKYINKKNIYLFIDNAYLVKIYNNQEPTFYDLLNKGNLGRNEKEYITKIDKKCKKEECTFILDAEYFDKKSYGYGWQYIIDFKDYVVNNYKYIETLPTKDKVYTNKKSK